MVFSLGFAARLTHVSITPIHDGSCSMLTPDMVLIWSDDRWGQASCHDYPMIHTWNLGPGFSQESESSGIASSTLCPRHGGNPSRVTI